MNGLVIVAHYDRQTLYVFTDENAAHITFHRWWQGRGSYKRWYNFRQRLMRNKKLNLVKCFNLADRYEVRHLISSRPVVIDGIEYNAKSEEVV